MCREATMPPGEPSLVDQVSLAEDCNFVYDCDSPIRVAMPPAPSTPATVMCRHLDQLETSVLIVGGGPHALAVLSALHERSFAYPQFASDAVFQQRVGFGSLQKIGTGEAAHTAVH